MEGEPSLLDCHFQPWLPPPPPHTCALFPPGPLDRTVFHSPTWNSRLGGNAGGSPFAFAVGPCMVKAPIPPAFDWAVELLRAPFNRAGTRQTGHNSRFQKRALGH